MKLSQVLCCLLIAQLTMICSLQAQKDLIVEVEGLSLTETSIQDAFSGIQLLKKKNRKTNPAARKLFRLLIVKLFKKVPQKINGALNLLKVTVPLVKMVDIQFKKGTYTPEEYRQKKQASQALLVDVIDSLLNEKTPMPSIPDNLLSLHEVIQEVKD